MLKISDNKRFLSHADGKPFFYLGDTAWELFHRCNKEETRTYLQDRAKKGFTVIQAVVLAEVDGIRTPNASGEMPLTDNDPLKPNEAYFAHVDWTVNLAESLGLHIGMLPTWGDKWNKKWGEGPEIFTPENAKQYGKWLGSRYKSKPIIWITGGDRPVENDTHRAVVSNMAEGLREGDGGAHLITFHPMGGSASSDIFHDSDWLSFNMWQSGHGRNSANYNLIAKDYARSTAKPVLDAEPGYEDHPAGFNLDNGYLDDYDNRKALYWALFAGACGHTYGCHPIWQMARPDRSPFSSCRRPWTEALHLPGSGQMQHGRFLVESRPYFSRIPDQSLITSEIGENTHHVQATRDAEGTYAFIYAPSPKEFTVHTGKLTAPNLVASWYDPRTGKAKQFDEFANTGTKTFKTPALGPDWVLVLDDVTKKYPALGKKSR